MVRDRVKELDDIETMAEDIADISYNARADGIIDKASEAAKRGADVARTFIGGVRSKYTDLVQNIEDNVKLDDFGKKVLEEVEINGLVDDIRREYYETAKAAKIVGNRLREKTVLLEEYIALGAITSGLEKMKIDGRKNYLRREIRALSNIIVELEGTKKELMEAYKDTSEKLLYVKFMRIPSHIHNLLSKADSLQAEGLKATSDIEEDEEVVENG